MQYIRWYENAVLDALKYSRVVIISGVRQCGKTTLIERISNNLKKSSSFRTLDDDDLLQLALDDPKGFVKHNDKTMIIDEVQKAPKLLPSIKMIVDKNNAKGQYLLTGSADINSLPEVSESLAGRIQNIRLRVLAQGEILSKKPIFIQSCLAKKFPSQIKGFDKKTIVTLAFRGGYPESVSLPENKRHLWFTNYIKAILKKDLKEISNIYRFENISRLFPILNSWSSKYIDLEDISSKLSVSKNTLKSYISLLKTLFLFDEVPAWVSTDYDRASKKDKFFSTDTGIMAHILSWEKDEVLLNSDKVGKLIETFVFNELSSQVGLLDGYNIYHYRDREKREIDFIIECPNNKIIAIESKAGETANFSDFKHINWFKTNIAKDKDVTGIVLYSGENILSYKENNYIIPIPFLWS